MATSGALTAPCGTLLPTLEARSTPSSSVKVWATVCGPWLTTWQALPSAATFEASSAGLNSGGDRGLPAQGCRARSGAAPAATTSVESSNYVDDSQIFFGCYGILAAHAGSPVPN
ncbi:hypothetical protein PC120_g15363 [Phytophthora cactorum]|nr:hypothetical protein PC120_g15363 [Phytophthora cactorum]